MLLYFQDFETRTRIYISIYITDLDKYSQI